MLTTNQKGAIAETAIACQAIKLGIPVLKPLVEERYDLVFELDGRFVRVQCKTASRHANVLVIRCYSSRRVREGFVKRSYHADEIDAVAAYSPDLDRCYFLPLDSFAGARYVQLRLAPALNNQQRGVNWANEFEFAATLGSRGAIAQLGEHLHGMQGVAGSSPASSTS